MTGERTIEGPGLLCLRFAFPSASEDLNEHVNNIEYVRMMQEVAIAHVEELGWPPERMRSDGVTWVVRSHHVEYRKPCFAGERIALWTWVHDFQRFRSRRRYRFVRESDGAVLAEAETEWVFFDFVRGRPAPIPADFRLKCPATPEEAEPSIGKPPPAEQDTL